MKTYTLEEQKANRKLWIDALRSGKYSQTEGTLRDNTGFCCLGVLCEVAEIPYEEGKYFEEMDVAPQEAMNFVGLNDNTGTFNPHGVTGINENSLAGINDEDTDFVSIADIIEKEPEGLFNND